MTRIRPKFDVNAGMDRRGGGRMGLALNNLLQTTQQYGQIGLTGLVQQQLQDQRMAQELANQKALSQFEQEQKDIAFGKAQKAAEDAKKAREGVPLEQLTPTQTQLSHYGGATIQENLPGMAGEREEQALALEGAQKQTDMGVVADVDRARMLAPIEKDKMQAQADIQVGAALKQMKGVIHLIADPTMKADVEAVINRLETSGMGGQAQLGPLTLVKDDPASQALKTAQAENVRRGTEKDSPYPLQPEDAINTARGVLSAIDRLERGVSRVEQEMGDLKDLIPATAQARVTSAEQLRKWYFDEFQAAHPWLSSATTGSTSEAVAKLNDQKVYQQLLQRAMQTAPQQPPTGTSVTPPSPDTVDSGGLDTAVVQEVRRLALKDYAGAIKALKAAGSDPAAVQKFLQDLANGTW